MTIAVGQCWVSQTEPELGLGFILEVDQRTITLNFPASDETRRYGIQSAPLKRVRFKVGDEIQSKDGIRIEITKITEENGLIVYFGKNKKIKESALSGNLASHGPEDKFFAGHLDRFQDYLLRSSFFRGFLENSNPETRGFLGPRVSLLPHQFYVASQVVERSHPRVLLADEVGLGKTIEAGLILHRLLRSERIGRVLVCAPSSLVNQWFVEMYRKFNLSFRVIHEEFTFDTDQNIADEQQLLIISTQLLSTSEEAKKAADASQWDLVIVDEAHRLDWTPQGESPEYRAIRDLAVQSPGLLLLTATPEQLGVEGHFARLHLLDPKRFPDLDAYLREQEEQAKIVELANKLISRTKLSRKDKKEIVERFQRLGIARSESELFATEHRRETVEDLIDLFGTGRIMFRNSRESLDLPKDFFPQRKLNPHPMTVQDPEDELEIFRTKLDWLVALLSKNKKTKYLLICRSKDLVKLLEEEIRSRKDIRTAVFHSEQDLLTRDRQASYFSDPEGAQILICSEIGSEGRNFQFASNLILFDLPLDPDLLEQRIGRLDRIGQKKDVEVHVPYLLGGYEEILFEWYDKGLSAFTSLPRGGALLGEEFADKLDGAIENPEAYFQNHREKLDDLIAQTQKRFREIQIELEKGRNRLLEIHSFHPELALQKVNSIQKIDRNQVLEKIMTGIFDHFGVQYEHENDKTMIVEPSDDMFLDYFPGLPSSGIQATFDRETAVEREDVSFLSWDHPMVLGSFDLFLLRHIGTASMATWKRPQGKAPFLMEVFAFVDYPVSRRFEPQRFLPTPHLRLVLNHEFKNVSSAWPPEELYASIHAASKEKQKALLSSPKEHMRRFFDEAHKHFGKMYEESASKAISEMQKSLNHERDRLTALRSKNQVVREEEISFLDEQEKELIRASKEARIRMDSFLVIA